MTPYTVRRQHHERLCDRADRIDAPGIAPGPAGQAQVDALSDAVSDGRLSAMQANDLLIAGVCEHLLGLSNRERGQ